MTWWARCALSYPHEFLLPSPKIKAFWERGIILLKIRGDNSERSVPTLQPKSQKNEEIIMSAARPNKPIVTANNPAVSQLSLFAGGRIVDAVAIPNTNTILSLELNANGSILTRHAIDEKGDKSATHARISQPHDHIDVFPSAQRAMTYSRRIEDILDTCTWNIGTLTSLDTTYHSTCFHPINIKFGDQVYRVVVNPVMGEPGEYALDCADFKNELDVTNGVSSHSLHENPNCLAAIPDTNEFLVGDSKGCTRFSISEDGAIVNVNTFAERKDDPISAIGVIATCFETVVDSKTIPANVATSTAVATLNVEPTPAEADATAATPPEVAHAAPHDSIVITGSHKGVLQTWRRTFSAQERPCMQPLGESAATGARVDYLMPIPNYPFAIMIAESRACWVDLSIVEKPEVLHSVPLTGDYQHEKRKCSYTRDAKLVTPYGEVIDAISYPDALLQTAASEFNRRSVAGSDVTGLMLRYLGMFSEAKINAFARATVEDIAKTVATPAAKK